MSLTVRQEENTRHELRENFEKTGLSLETVAADLETTPAYIAQVLELNARSFNHTWILRNYLYEKVKEAGQTPTEFTALKESHRNYWFLDSNVIDRGTIRYS